MSFRVRIRVISYAAALFVVLAAALAACHVGAGRYITRIDAQSTRAFGEAIDAVDQLRVTLRKCELAKGASMQNDVCTQIYSSANSAETALSALPVELDALENISRHISVLGDYAYSLSRLAAGGESLPEEDLIRLQSLSESTTSLYEQLSSLRRLYQDHMIVSERFDRLTDSMDNLAKEMDRSTGTLDSEFHAIADRFPATESFFYDGSYCDRSGECARMLEGRAEVSEQEARDAAAAFLQIDTGELKPLGRSEGDIPCWRFQIHDGEEAAFIAVTISGGIVIRYLSPNDREFSEDHSKTSDAGKAFLLSRGYDGFEAAPFISGGGADCFAPTQDGVLCMADQISVRINAQTGELYGFDATDFVKHHHERDNNVFQNAESAREQLPENVVVSEEFNVWILSPGGRELPCRAYLCDLDTGDRAIIYVDLTSNEQVRIEMEGEFVA